jgi:hypothetical protein
MKENGLGRACGTSEEKRNTCGILGKKHEAKTPLTRPKHRWEDNIKMDFKENGI